MPNVGLIVCSFLLPIILINFLPTLAFPIASFIIAGRNIGATCCANATINVTCDINGTVDPNGNFTCNLTSCNEPMMTLSTWLYVNAAVTLAFCTVTLVTILIVCAVLFTLEDTALVATIGTASLAFFVLMVVFSCFVLAWNIVGAVVLFRDNEGCLKSNIPLWAMTLACLIIQWLSLLANCCDSCKHRKKNDE
jgi:hypothetical protein